MKTPKLCRNPDGRAYATYPKTGGKKREYFGQHGTPEAIEAYRQWLVRLLSGEAAQPVTGKRTISELCDLYADHINAMPVTKSYRLHIFRSIALLVPHGLETHDWMTVPNIRSVLNSLKIRKYRRQPHLPEQEYSRATVNDMLQSIKLFVKWCATNSYVPVEVWHRVQLVEPLKKGVPGVKSGDKVRPVDLNAVRLTLPHLTTVTRTMVQIQYLCGMRPQDVCRMRWCDIDQSDNIWLYCPVEHKNTHRGLELTKAVPVAAQTLLRTFPTENDTDFIFTPKRSMENVRRILSGESATRVHYSPKNYGSAIRTACVKAGVNHWTPNQLRHAIGTDIRSQRGLEAAQNYLGHSSSQTTLIYAERAINDAKESAKGVTNPFQ